MNHPSIVGTRSKAAADVTTVAAGNGWGARKPQRAQDLKYSGAVRGAVVLGAGALADRVCDSLREGARPGVHLLARFDDRRRGRSAGRHSTWSALRRGSLAEAAPFIRQHGVQEVYIALPLSSQPRIAALMQDLQDTPASIHYVPDVLCMTVIQGRIRDLDGVPVVGLCESPLRGAAALAKRIEDLLLAGTALALLWPLMLAIALAVRLDSPGPALFRQRRVGLDGRQIEVWKFRTLHTLEDGPQVQQVQRDDPRITRLGALLRRTSLDELPQFLNVIQGRMSVVGPRPHALAHHEQFMRVASAYMVRHKVRPGITGLAQVRGLRGATDSAQKIRARLACDLEYLRCWSLALDLRIVARTAWVVLRDRSAY